MKSVRKAFGVFVLVAGVAVTGASFAPKATQALLPVEHDRGAVIYEHDNRSAVIYEHDNRSALIIEHEHNNA